MFEPGSGLSLAGRAGIAALAGLMALGAVAPAFGQQAVVRSYDAPELEVGQAWLMHNGGRCYAVLPWHVATETSVPSLLREDGRGLRGEATEVVELGDDAAIARLGGGITQDCGYSSGSISRAVARHVRDGGLGTLRSVNGDGTLGRLSVTIIDDDGVAFLRVLPTIEGERIRKGHSGSLLLMGDQPVGMLLSVHARSGVGTVMRTDALLAKVDGFLRGGEPPAPAPAPAPAASGRAEGVQAGPWRVTAWNSDPAGSAHVAAHLTAAGEQGFWAARAERWPVTLELGGPDAVRVVRGVAFHVGAAPDGPSLPARVQVMTSASADGTAWRVAASGVLEFVAGVAVVEFVPARARRVRVEIFESQGAPAEVALGRLRVIE